MRVQLGPCDVRSKSPLPPPQPLPAVRHQARTLAPLLAVLFGSCLWFTGFARADAGSGTWSGTAQGGLNYYYEGSTRVYMPEVRVTAESPDGWRAGVHGLLDVITSASVRTGRTTDALQDEYRGGVQLSAGKTLNQRNYRLLFDASARYSDETDYTSLSGGLDVGLSLNADNTVLRVGGARLHDDIRSNIDPDFAGTLDAWSATLGVEQVLNPTMVLTISYQLGHQTGYLGNPYRSVGREGAPEREQPPELRVRHGLSSRWAWYVVPAQMGVHALCRVYGDTWDVFSVAPELRLYKELGYWLVRLRYRYYTQTRAWFYRQSYPRDWDDPFTEDFKLDSFDSHTLGLRLELETAFLGNFMGGLLSDTTLYLSADRVFSGMFYGNQIIGSGGFILHL